MRDIELKNEIKELILSQREDDYWDFKQQHHTNKADLLHDIICMANNRVDRDAYIIFGITDKTCEIVGVKNDENRKNQQMIIDFLKPQKFVSGIRPRVEMRTLILADHEVDILIVKNSTDTPYFLTDRYSDGNKTVRSNHIYTRVGDTNTDIDKSADINNIEYLWKKRFLLTRSPFEQIIKRLENKDEWKRDDDTYYNIFNPEFTIIIDKDNEFGPRGAEFYAYVMEDSSPSYRMLTIKYYGTQLFNCQVVLLDGGRYLTPTPEWDYFFFGEVKMNPDYAMKYFTKDSPKYKLHEFIYNEENYEEEHVRSRFFEVVLLFETELEKDAFMGYIYRNKEVFLYNLNSLKDNFWTIEVETERQREYFLSRLKTGTVLNQMLIEYRQMQI
ncbi:ATP-binding protein [Paenibacillus sp. 2TAB23]|uniref:ATP-binding protein n=1 Tax=Paenibacillus sp. 2TAB23 TaxID=3233004 RepID=UPI003F9C1A34